MYAIDLTEILFDIILLCQTKHCKYVTSSLNERKNLFSVFCEPICLLYMLRPVIKYIYVHMHAVSPLGNDVIHRQERCEKVEHESGREEMLHVSGVS